MGSLKKKGLVSIKIERVPGKQASPAAAARKPGPAQLTSGARCRNFSRLISSFFFRSNKSAAPASEPGATSARAPSSAAPAG